MTWIDRQDQAEVTKALDTLREAAPDSPMATSWARFTTYSPDLRFCLWLVYVDRRIARRTGLSVFDMPDWTWRDAFDSDMSPQEAVLSFAEDNREEMNYWG